MTDTLFPLRYQLLGQGYTPLPNSGKQTFLKDWPRVVVDEAMIRGWDTGKHRRDRSTGIRIDPPLAMIDLDCDSPAVAERFWARARRLAPQLAKALERRRSNSERRAWLLRTEQPFIRLASHVWVDKDGHTAQLELFGGGDSAKGGATRQMGAFGPHSPGSDYEWLGDRSPLTVPPVELPVLPREMFGELGDIFDEVMTSRGWTMAGPKPSASNGATAYDLTEDMRFNMQDGRTLSLRELSDEAEAHDGGESYLRCDARPFRAESDNRSVCSCTWHPDRGLQIYDFSTAVKHYRMELDPERRIEELATLLLVPPAGADAVFDPPPQRAHDEAVARLMRDFALCRRAMNGHGGILEIVVNGWELHIACTRGSMAMSMMPFDLVVRGPRGGIRRVSPVDTWLASPDHVEVEGVRMRPDQPYPLFEDSHGRWINSYAPPVHEAGGSTHIFQIFMEHLLPSPPERRWFLQAMAHKVQHPEVPGPGIVMVAEQYGSGRGTLYTILIKLFGARFVAPIGFDLLVGTSASARFNDWEAESLLVLVDEAATPQEDHSTLRNRRSMYENLKNIIDPAAHRKRKFEAKGKQAFYGRSYATFIIASNNRDALELPAEDRRFAVLENGPTLSAALADQVYAWMERPENIGALYEELQRMRTDEFNPFRPPPLFAGKEAMIGASGSVIGEAIDEALEAFGAVFTVRQVQTAMSLNADTTGLPTNWHAIVSNEIRHRFTRCGPHDLKFRMGEYRSAAYTRDREAYKQAVAGGNSTLQAWVKEVLAQNEHALRRQN